MKKYISKNKWLVLAYLMMSLVSSGMTVYLSIILRDIIDVAVSLDLDGFYSLLVTAAIFFVLLGVVHYVTEVLYAWFIARVLRNIQEDVFGGIMKQDIGQFESVNSADYISALTNDIKLLEDNYFLSLATAAQMGMETIIAIGFMIYFSFIVAIGLLVTSIVLIGAQALFGAPIRKRQTRLSESLSRFTIKIKDIFSGFEVIKSYQMNRHVKKSFQKCNNDVIRSNFSLHHFSTIAGAVASVIGLFLQVGVVFFSAYLIIQGRLSTGAMVGMLIVSGQITGPIQEIGQMIPMITGSKEIVRRLEGFAMRESGYRGSQVATFSSGIRVEKLEFTYPEQEIPALNGVDFTFEKNKKYALIGQSGCGKTTFAKALMGHLNGYSGEVLYDQVELKELTDTSFGKLPTMVHQNVYMFDEDIEQNIRLHKAYTHAELQSAIEDSGVSLFLNDERTLRALVGENGSNLSGGQRQRIAVARALIQNKPLLILDEGTSAVDKQTGADIERRLLKREDLTLLTITHSLDEEMLNQYDEIIYMEEGLIIESGPFADLMESDGKFRQYMFPTSALTEQEDSVAELHEEIRQDKLPISAHEKQDHSVEELGGEFHQHERPTSALAELNQSLAELHGEFSQYLFPTSALEELTQSSKELQRKFSQYKFQTSIFKELNQSLKELHGEFRQSKFSPSALTEQNQSLKELHGKFDQYMFPISALEGQDQSFGSVQKKVGQYKFSPSVFEQQGQSLKESVSLAKSTFFS